MDEAKLEDVQEITLDSLNIANNYTIKKEGEDWKMSSPQEKTMKKEEVTSAVSAISNLSADEIIMEDTYKEKLEKDSNSTIKFIIKDKKGVPISVSIFVEGKNKETNSYYVKKDSIDTVYKLNEHKLKSVLELNIPKEKEKEKKK